MRKETVKAAAFFSLFFSVTVNDFSQRYICGKRPQEELKKVVREIKVKVVREIKVFHWS